MSVMSTVHLLFISYKFVKRILTITFIFFVISIEISVEYDKGHRIFLKISIVKIALFLQRHVYRHDVAYNERFIQCWSMGIYFLKLCGIQLKFRI